MEKTLQDNRELINNVFHNIINLCKIDIIDLTQEECDILKKETLYSNSMEKIGKERYMENMFNILNYQIKTIAPIKTLCVTCGYLLDSLVDDFNIIEISLLQSAITLLSYIDEYGIGNDMYEARENFFDENDIDGEFLSIDDGFNKKDGKIYAIWNYLFNAYLGRYRAEGEIIKIDGDFCITLNKFYSLIGQHLFVKLYQISKPKINRYCLYCLEWILFENHYTNLYDVYSPVWLTKLSNHPILKYNESHINVVLQELRKWCLKIFEDKFSSLYINFLFDCCNINICRNSGVADNNIKHKLDIFFNDYKYIGNLFLGKNKQVKKINDNLLIKSINDHERNSMISQWLYFKFIKDQIVIKKKLQDMELKDFKDLFYLIDRISKTNWYLKCKDFFYINNKLKIYWEEFELSRLFLYQKIGKEQFDWLHSIYDDTIGEPRLKNLYNLVLGKFSLAFVKYGVDYFTEGYLLFLKQMFKNIWLQTPGNGLEIFDLPKEKGNDFGILELDNEEILELLSSDESLNLEYKASFSFDWKKFGNDKKEEECEYEKHKVYPFLKPIVSMLNAKGGSILVGVREKAKVNEAVKKGEIKLNNLGDIKDFNKNLYLTGVERDFKFFGGNEDNVKQNIDKVINEKIDPSPNSVGCHVEINFYDIAGKKLCLLTVPDTVDKIFFLKEPKDKDIIKKLYIRNNANDEELKDPEKIVNFTKSKTNNH